MLEISFVIEPNCVWLAFIVSIDFGITYLKDKKGKLIAKSIVDSGHYKNKRQYADEGIMVTVNSPRKENGSRPNLKRPGVDGAIGVGDFSKGSEGRGCMIGSSSKYVAEKSEVLPFVTKDKVGKLNVKGSSSKHAKEKSGVLSFVTKDKVGKLNVKSYFSKHAGEKSGAAARDKSLVVPFKQGKQCVVGPNLKRPRVDAIGDLPEGSGPLVPRVQQRETPPRVDAEVERTARLRVNKALSQNQEELTRLCDSSFEHVKGNSRYIATAERMRTFRKWVNRDKGFGNIPGVNVGDKFRHGAKMRVVGLHGDYNKGIDWLKDTKGNIIAKSIIDSHRYKNKRIYADLLIYTREGGNPDVSK
ncbi:hypothetical protein ACLB2K_070159 [Fragaria x ananassa]